MKWPKWVFEEFNKISKDLDWNNVSPDKNDVLNFTKMNPNDIKVIILGQDPYPTKGVANGYAFAVNEDCKVPMSLRNMFKEIDEVQGYVKADKTLKHWNNQGVLLLNTYLTVEIGKPGSHKKLWDEFSKRLLDWIDNNLEITWVLWGNESKKKGKNFTNKKIEDAHPSPLSVRHRNKVTFKELNFIEW